MFKLHSSNYSGNSLKEVLQNAIFTTLVLTAILLVLLLALFLVNTVAVFAFTSVVPLLISNWYWILLATMIVCVVMYDF